MAIVRKMSLMPCKEAAHTEVQATYSVITVDGEKFLQIDTYGSPTRKMPGKKSQSIRFSQEALNAISRVIKAEFS
jgi:hypothetical protein